MLHSKILFNHRGHREHGEKSRVRVHSRSEWGKTKNEKSASGLYAWLWSWLFICASMLVVHAQEIDMSGNIDFTPIGDSVTLSAETIRNYRAQGSTSGNLILQLWATKVPYYGQARLSESPLNGFKMGEASLGTLSGNNSRSNVNESVVFTRPSAGYYNVVLVLGELNGSDYHILDWFNFTEIQAFGGLTPFTPPATSAPKTLIDEYIGTWEEVQSVTINGTTSETAVTTLIERLQDRGFISKAYIRKPGSPLIETQTSHYENGSLNGTSASNGMVIEDSVGEWGVSDRTIVSNTYTSYTQTTGITLTNSREFISSLATSDGSEATGQAEKIMMLATAPSPTPPYTPPSAPPSTPPTPLPVAPAKKVNAKPAKKVKAKPALKKTSTSSAKKATAKKAKKK
jgi:hypothetical protein